MCNPLRPGGAQAGPKVLATPTARKLAEREGIPISAVTGTGISGRVMKADVMEAKAAPRPAEARPKPSEIKPVSKYDWARSFP